jgi:hypothetical protein
MASFAFFMTSIHRRAITDNLSVKNKKLELIV